MASSATVRSAVRKLLLMTACGWGLLMPSFARAEDLTRASLQAAYAHVGRLSAEIEQKKSSPYLFKPLVSKIHMEYANGRILWRVLEPVRGEIVFDNGTISTAPAGVLPPDALERMMPLMRLFRAIFSVDLPAIEKDFDLRFSDRSLEAQSRAGSDVHLVKRLVFHFDAGLLPERMTVEVGDEITELRFLHFESSSASVLNPTP